MANWQTCERNKDSIREPLQEVWITFGRRGICLTWKRRQFGQVKYLKDNDDDCDLDPDLTVADLLVDEGKAARDGSDQKKIIKLIQEQGRAVRQGSMIPDLTPVHYQPRTLPPIPRFTEAARRRTEDRQLDDRPTKRRRLDQIDEETNQIVSSIERDGERASSHFELPDAHFMSALNGNLRNVEPALEPKIESPELASTWINTGPATIDELEYLPEAPTHFRPRSRTGPNDLRRRQEPGPEIRESSIVPQEEQQRQRMADLGRSHYEADERQAYTSHTHAPLTPSNSGTNARTPGGQVVSMLNSMKSQSPAIRQSTSASASRFRKPAKNVYDYPESDIDDTQMSPRSRALRTRITPKLVQTPHTKGKLTTLEGTPHRYSQQQSIVQESPTWRRTNGDDTMDVNRDREHQLPHLQSHERTTPSTKLTSKSLERVDPEQDGEVASDQQRRLRKSFNQEGSSNLGSDETWSIHEDGTRRKRPRQSRTQRRSGGDVSTSRSSSLASSAKNASTTERSTSGRLKRKRVAPTRVNDGQSRSEFSELDSPGMQLSETLRRSSPASRPSKASSQNVSESLTRSSRASERGRQTEQTEDAEMEDIERSPESVSESEEELPLAKAPKRPKSRGVSSQSVASKGVRCWTCWTKQSLCDNRQPKCDKCVKNKKNCQKYALTQEEFKVEKDRRQAEKKSKTTSSGKTTGKTDRPKPGAKTSGQRSSKDDIDDEPSTKHSDKSNEMPKPDKKQEEESASEEVSTSSADESSQAGSKLPLLKGSQSRNKRPTTRKQSTTETSAASDSADDEKMNTKGQDSPDNTKEPSTSMEDQQAQVKANLRNKRPPGNTSIIPSSLPSNDFIKAKGSDHDSKIASAVETVREDLPVTPKDAYLVPTEKSTTRERSMESRVTSTGKVLPTGMSEEQYEALISARANLTEQQRKDLKMRNRKLDKRSESTPSLVQQSSTQELIENPKKTPSVKSIQQVSSSQSNSRIQSKPPPSTQPARAPTSMTSSTPEPASIAPPESAPAKPNTTTTTVNSSSSKTKLKLQPTSANKGPKIKSPNPPFQPHQPQSNPILSTSATAAQATPSSLNASRSLKDIRAVLTSQSRSGSGASTPQPARATAARIAEIRRGVTGATAKKNITSLSDDDDDEDDSDEDEEDEEDEKNIKKTLGNTAVSGNARGNVTVRRRTPSDSGSASASDTDTSKTGDESGSDSDSEDEDDEQ